MKKVKKLKAGEPTLGEVLAVMNERFTIVEKRIDQRFGTMNERSDSIDARLGDVQRKLTNVESRVEDIQDDLTSALHATGNDGLAILNHEHRISHLEKLGGIKSIPAKHLAGL